ncbi:MAG: hypothetical protein AAGB22_01730 [Bacteroidota bacterium]
MRWWLLIGLWCGLIHPVLGQDVPHYVLQGKLVLSDSITPVPLAHVIRLPEGRGVIADTVGRFELRFQEGDSLLVSAVGVAPFMQALTAADSSRQLIVMQLDTAQLEMYNALGLSRETEFRQSFLKMRPSSTSGSSGITLSGVTQYTGPRKPVTPGVGSPVSFLYNQLSREARRKRKLKRYRDMVRKAALESP